jgi:signal transduction histidine kinase
MGVGQVLAWPVGAFLFGGLPAPLDVAGAVVVTVVVAVALGWRRRAPVQTLVVVVLALVIGTIALPTDVLVVIGPADLVVLFSLAAVRPAHHAVIAVAVLLTGWITMLVAMDEPDLGWAIGLVVVLYVVAALGSNRGRWQRARAAVAARLFAADAQQRRAAEAERERLARELHDVTAHHLTAIVVNAGAARRLGAGKLELVRQALEFVAETGRRTFTALNRLVTVIEPGVGEPLVPRLARLASTARSTGQQVGVTVTGCADDLPPAVVDAVFAVVQEAATNALRYAAGAGVTATVEVSADSVRVAVTNPEAGSGPLGCLGSGRGLIGLSARVKGSRRDILGRPVPRRRVAGRCRGAQRRPGGAGAAAAVERGRARRGDRAVGGDPGAAGDGHRQISGCRRVGVCQPHPGDARGDRQRRARCDPRNHRGPDPGQGGGARGQDPVRPGRGGPGAPAGS